MNDHSTRERILESASRMFSDKGFRDTTIADICADAKANIAAVNYHFGNKDRLYEAVWQHAHDLTQAAYPVPELDTSAPGMWLRAFVRCRVLAILDEGPSGWFSKIVGREMTHPTPLLSELRGKFLRPGKQQLETAVRLMLGPSATPLHIHCGMMNVLSLYAFLNTRRRVGGVLCRQKFDNAQTEQVVAQVAEFALAGLHGARQWVEGL